MFDIHFTLTYQTKQARSLDPDIIIGGKSHVIVQVDSLTHKLEVMADGAQDGVDEHGDLLLQFYYNGTPRPASRLRRWQLARGRKAEELVLQGEWIAIPPFDLPQGSLSFVVDPEELQLFLETIAENPDIHLVLEDDWGKRSAVPDLELRLLRTCLTRYSEDIKLDVDPEAENLQTYQIKDGESLNQDDLKELWKEEKSEQ